MIKCEGKRSVNLIIKVPEYNLEKLFFSLFNNVDCFEHNSP